ncbi:hypothetical protein JCM19297_2603 [Nonlabens ulvanivorans]|nr:hypothetical protein [Nonlabens ulvanivorans]GAK91158.1 hypothetical protein JCM19297_2603 [Nonlabens ulvanivorans]
MKSIILFILVLITATSCFQKSNKVLNLTGPSIEQAENINRTSNQYVDGIYEASETETSLSYQQSYGVEKTFYINYRPIIVAKDFKVLQADIGSIGRPVIDIELHEHAHLIWYEATKRAFLNKSLLFIVINGKVVSAPSVNGGPISGGKLQILGDFNMEQIQQMINGIKKRAPKAIKEN